LAQLPGAQCEKRRFSQGEEETRKGEEQETRNFPP
jgi:hypothetical protein